MNRYKLNPSRLSYLAALAALSAGVSQTLAETSPADKGRDRETGASYNLGLEEIIVTASKRAESLMDVPVSVNALNAEKLSEAAINDLENLTAYVPNFTMQPAGIGSNIFIRGIGSGINQSFEQSVGMYIDGIHYGRAQLYRAPFLDLERVEVLRGPQGTLFGKNSIAGAINITTAKPGRDFHAGLTAMFEPDADEKDLQAVVSGPLAEGLLGRVAIKFRDMEGYVDNTTLDRDEPNTEELIYRATLLWEASEDLDITAKLEKGAFDLVGRSIEIVNDTETDLGVGYSSALRALGYDLDTRQDFKRQANEDFSLNDTENFTLTVDYLVGDHTLIGITGYNAYEYTDLCDCDFTGLPIFDVVLKEDYRQISQEIRLESATDGPLDYIVGLFYQSSDLTYTDRINVPDASILAGLSPLLPGTSSARIYGQDTDSLSVFSQASWKINPALSLTLGARLSREKKNGERRQWINDAVGTVVDAANPLNIVYAGLKIETHEIADSRRNTAFTPLLTLEYRPHTDFLTYATYTTGFKSGGFDARSNAHPDAAVGVPGQILEQFGMASFSGVFEYDEEEAQSMEVGAKLTLADGRAELNAALYRTEYEDLQISVTDGSLGFNVGNAAEAVTQGLELDGRWRLSESIVLQGAYAYLDFEFRDYANGQCHFQDSKDNGSGLCDFSGARNLFTPEHFLNIGVDYTVSLTESLQARLGADVIYSDNYFASPTLDPRAVQSSYTKVNARVSLGPKDSQWEIALLGRNLTDESVMTYANSAPLATTLTNNAGTAYYGFFERPRSVSLQVRYQF